LKLGQLYVEIELALDVEQFSSDLPPLLHPIPPFIQPQRQQDRPDDHNAFHEDAQPGDGACQLGIRCFSSSKKFWTRIGQVALLPAQRSPS